MTLTETMALGLQFAFFLGAHATVEVDAVVAVVAVDAAAAAVIRRSRRSRRFSRPWPRPTTAT